MRWKRREKKLWKRKQKLIKHGKAFGEMVRNAVRKRQGVSDLPPQQEEKRGPPTEVELGPGGR